jgi:hypothetical protein
MRTEKREEECLPVSKPDRFAKQNKLWAVKEKEKMENAVCLFGCMRDEEERPRMHATLRHTNYVRCLLLLCFFNACCKGEEAKMAGNSLGLKK